MLEKLTKDLINKFINEIKKDDNQKKLEFEIFNPILTKFYQKIYNIFYMDVIHYSDKNKYLFVRLN